jgi:hypothetical protein
LKIKINKTVKNKYMETLTAERPIPIANIYSGDRKIMSRSALYDYRDRGLIKFHYLGKKPYVYYSQINAAMSVDPKDPNK